MNPLDTLKKLKLEHLKREYPNVPDYAIPAPKYSEGSANELTKCVIDFLNLSGHLAERHSNEGRVIDNRKTYTDVIGRQKTIGTLKRISSNQVNGTSDIKATINGRMIAIEIKFGLDKQSPAQAVYQERVERAGGEYWIVKDFTGFLENYHRFTSQLKLF